MLNAAREIEKKNVQGSLMSALDCFCLVLLSYRPALLALETALAFLQKQSVLVAKAH